jgi:lipopolysaccharide biosynthesis glycosyltransferase
VTDPIVVACAADRAYVRPLAVMLVSLLAHLDRDRTLDVHIVDGDIPEPDKRSLERSLDSPRARVVWHAPNRRQLLGVPLWGRLPIRNAWWMVLAFSILMS